MNAYGYHEKGAREYPELRGIVKLHFGNYVSSLKAIKVYVIGSYMDRMITTRALFIEISDRYMFRIRRG